MIEVKDLLRRFEHIILSEENRREAVRLAVAETLNIPVGPGEIRIKGSTVYLNVKPIYKSEIFMKREKIEERLTELLHGKNSPLELR